MCQFLFQILDLVQCSLNKLNSTHRVISPSDVLGEVSRPVPPDEPHSPGQCCHTVCRQRRVHSLGQIDQSSGDTPTYQLDPSGLNKPPLTKTMSCNPNYVPGQQVSGTLLLSEINSICI